MALPERIQQGRNGTNPAPPTGPAHVVEGGFRQAAEEKKRSWRSYRKPVGKAILVVVVGVGGYMLGGGGSPETVEAQPSTPATAPSNPGIEQEAIVDNTVVVVAPPTEAPSVVEGPLADPDLNSIYAKYSAEIEQNGPIPLTKEFFEAELNGDYELGWQLWMKDLEETISRMDQAGLVNLFMGGEGTEVWSSYSGIIAHVEDIRSLYSQYDMINSRPNLVGTATIVRTDANYAVIDWNMELSEGTLEGFLQRDGLEGRLKGNAQGCELGFNEGLLKLGDCQVVND